MAAGVVLDSTWLPERYAPGAELFGVVALAALAAGLALRLSPLVPVAVALLGAGYALSIVGRGDTVDDGVLLVAPALLLVAELAYRSFEPRGIRPERSLVAGDAAVLVALLGASVVTAGALLGTTTLDAGGRSALVAAGVIAAAGALALTARLARRG